MSIEGWQLYYVLEHQGNGEREVSTNIFLILRGILRIELQIPPGLSTSAVLRA